MTNPNLTHLAFVLDRSGSMGHAGKATEAENGVRRLLEEQTELPGELRVTIARFDDRYEMVLFDRYTETINPSSLRIVPRGMTALYDAVGRTVHRLGSHFASQPEHERPGRVIVVIATDGIENASREFSPTALRELITEHRETYSWDFVFIGTSEDQLTSAVVDMGTSYDSTIATADSGDGYAATYAVASSAITRSRAGGQSVNFTDEDRRKAAKAKRS